ncbi:D-alanyl-D-alanine dipeptidase [Constrictibacter sp. MBR-5]|jgi:D-alanyl-D-alanine dipeptidase
MMLVEITPESHGVEIDLAYATPENFTGKPIYVRAACFLLPEAEAALRRAVAIAAGLDLRLRVYDAFRPVEAQWALWNHTPDPNYVADPRKGGPHTRGAAVDLTLLRPDGSVLDMGTGFDDLRPQSHHGVTDIPAEAQRNRLILLGIMTAAGWDFYRNEWWHYQLFDSRRFASLTDVEAGTNIMTPA